MDLELSGKVAVVTGASQGIGLAIATSLAAERVSVAAGRVSAWRRFGVRCGVGRGRVRARHTVACSRSGVW